MENGSKFYMVKKKALPEILLKVAEANVLLNRGKAKTIKEAIDAVGISRSSYYKYKDDIFPIHEKIQGKTITFVMEMEDQPGLLSSILKIVADLQKVDILQTLHQQEITDYQLLHTHTERFREEEVSVLSLMLPASERSKVQQFTNTPLIQYQIGEVYE